MNDRFKDLKDPVEKLSENKVHIRAQVSTGMAQVIPHVLPGCLYCKHIPDAM